MLKKFLQTICSMICFMAGGSEAVLSLEVKGPPQCYNCTLMRYPDAILECKCTDPVSNREEKAQLNLTISCPHALSQDGQLIENKIQYRGMLACPD